MIRKIFNKASDFIHNPVETFQKSKDDPFIDVVTYYLVLFILDSVLTLVVSSGDLIMLLKKGLPNVGGSIDPFMLFLIIFGNDLFRILFLGTIGLLIGGIIVHISIHVLGGRKGLQKTFTALMYGLTPYLITSWIASLVSHVGFEGDILSFFGLLVITGWTVVIIFYGVRELQEISSERAGVAVAGPLVILPFIVVVLVALMWILSYGAGMVNVLESMKPPITFSIERTNDTIMIKNVGLRTANPIRVDEISRLEVSLFGVPNGTIGTAAGSVLTLVSPSCPADVGITAVYRNGTRRKIDTIKDKNCINDITGISIEKSEKTITVRNTGGPRLGEVSKLTVGFDPDPMHRSIVASMVRYSALGITPGSETKFNDSPLSSDESRVIVTASLNNGATWSWFCDLRSHTC